MPDALKPCPFCGERAALHIQAREFDRRGAVGVVHVVTCDWCGASVEGTDWIARGDGMPGFPDEAAAIAAWNRREDPCPAVTCDACGADIHDAELLALLRQHGGKDHAHAFCSAECSAKALGQAAPVTDRMTIADISRAIAIDGLHEEFDRLLARADSISPYDPDDLHDVLRALLAALVKWRRPYAARLAASGGPRR